MFSSNRRRASIVSRVTDHGSEIPAPCCTGEHAAAVVRQKTILTTGEAVIGVSGRGFRYVNSGFRSLRLARNREGAGSNLELHSNLELQHRKTQMCADRSAAGSCETAVQAHSR